MRMFLARCAKRICELFPRPTHYVAVEVPVVQSSLLNGRTAFITGGAGGIGFAIAKAFLSAGASVIIAGRAREKLDRAVHELQIYGKVSSVVLDVTKPNLFADTIFAAGEFDILVNNAGFVSASLFGRTGVDEYDKVMETNLRGAYFVSQVVSNHWIANHVKGNILNICSASSLRPGNTPYILSKWGLRSLTVGMAKELIKHNIVVNGIAPGCTNTPQFCDSANGDITNPANPARRFVTMTEIAGLSVMLVSGLARMVVGDILYVTGGAGVTTLDD